jgi:hypothetical protein
MPEETITLRDAARRLTLAKDPKAKKFAERDLLGLLRSGELKAGFYILSGTVWIDVPLAHWEKTGGDKFRALHLRRGDPKSGTYKVRANKFPDQVAKVICQKVANDKAQQAENSVAAIVTAAAESYEVTLKSKDFQDYLERRGLKESFPTTTGGRHQKNWRDVSSYMAAYMVAHHRDLTAALKTKEASEVVYKLAEAGGISDLPAADTIKDQISKAEALLGRPEFKLKK